MVDITNDDIGESNRLALWEMMLKLRLVEKKAYDLFLQNLIKGTSHLALGQEAIAGAFGVSLQEGDYTFCTYRGHAHTLARGSSIEGVLGELMLTQHIPMILAQCSLRLSGPTLILIRANQRSIT